MVVENCGKFLKEKNYLNKKRESEVIEAGGQRKKKEKKVENRIKKTVRAKQFGGKKEQERQTQT